MRAELNCRATSWCHGELLGMVTFADQKWQKQSLLCKSKADTGGKTGYFQYNCFIFLVYIHRRGIARPYGNSVFNLFQKLQPTVFEVSDVFTS